VTEAESFAISSAVETLMGEESQSKEDIISGLFSGEGELQGVACKDITLSDWSSLDQNCHPDSRLIEIAQVAKHPHQHPSEEVAVEDAVDEPDAGAGTTPHGHTGSLLFVQESELEAENDAPAVGEVPPADVTDHYEAEPDSEHKPAEVAESVRAFARLARQPY